MPAAQASWTHRLLGPSTRLRVRVSQTLLGLPALALIHLLLLVEWRMGQVATAPMAWFIGLSWAGCLGFFLLVRSGWSERLSSEASLSTPQMAYAMACVAWGYALAGPYRAAMLSLMPLILSFGIFALDARAARGMAYAGIVMMGVTMGVLATRDPVEHEPLQEAANWLFVSLTMGLTRVLADRLQRMRARLSEQKAELSAALEHIRLLATRDALTGLLNRRAMHEELVRAVGQAARHGRPLVVALADLDHFKQINDGYGHQTGDRVLQAFAQVAERELRGADLVARWGGEEFLFVLPDTGEAQARTCLDRVRQALCAVKVEGLPAAHPLSFSAGVSLCSGPDDVEAAIERADQAMYRAKVNGRSRTACCTAEPAAMI